MIQIRDNTFETNSSSSHSLIITDFDGKYTPEEMMKGIYLWNDKETRMYENNLEFYRSPFSLLATFESKSRYAIASSQGHLADEVEKIWHKYIPNFNGFKFDMKTEEYDYDKKEWVDLDEPKPIYGGTDDYQIEGWLKSYNVSLEDFLTMRRYMVVCDGDETHEWYHILDSGLVDKSHIIHDSEKEVAEAWKRKYEEENKK
jgi:hypothetical protein